MSRLPRTIEALMLLSRENMGQNDRPNGAEGGMDDGDDGSNVAKSEATIC